ncbi:hypothetical protein CDAR_6311 [Caerostris darwini]|uniref:Uncharacterized protein n=1 Tax=Caerostris darwini TaxID=1538125 RepID=A0AAV4MM01_9ARAC|nr:hypothetical protein CDAR_6311 [Caerostris darwini]
MAGVQKRRRQPMRSVKTVFVIRIGKRSSIEERECSCETRYQRVRIYHVFGTDRLKTLSCWTILSKLQHFMNKAIIL